MEKRLPTKPDKEKTNGCVRDAMRRVRDLSGWPPSRFQSAEEPFKEHVPKGELCLEAVTYVPGHPGKEGFLLMILMDKDGGTACTARVKVAHDLGRPALLALFLCRGMTLEQAGREPLPMDSAHEVGKFPENPAATLAESRERRFAPP
jgi:hypothetical protein